MNSKKEIFYKLSIITLLLLSIVSGCSSGETSKTENKGTATSFENVNQSDSGFAVTLNNYMTAQQELMLVQSNVDSQDFEDLSQHAKDLINSSEYKIWLTESKKLENYDISGLTSEKDYKDIQKAILDYDKIQVSYFTELATAKTQSDYNEINGKFIEKLNSTQDSLFDIYNSLSK